MPRHTLARFLIFQFSEFVRQTPALPGLCTNLKGKLLPKGAFSLIFRTKRMHLSCDKYLTDFLSQSRIPLK